MEELAVRREEARLPGFGTAKEEPVRQVLQDLRHRRATSLGHVREDEQRALRPRRHSPDGSPARVRSALSGLVSALVILSLKYAMKMLMSESSFERWLATCPAAARTAGLINRVVQKHICSNHAKCYHGVRSGGLNALAT